MNEAAFPTDYFYDQESGHEILPSKGMTLRDYFAAKAMHGFITESGMNIGPNAEADDVWYAKKAYEMADAMLKARQS